MEVVMTEVAILEGDALREKVEAVPRARFMPLNVLSEAGGEEGHVSRFVLPPVGTVVRMLSALKLKPDSRVLEIGTGFGYTAAILGDMVAEVHTLERRPERVRAARERLADYGATRVTVYEGDDVVKAGIAGTFDQILISTSDGDIARKYLRQLKVGGRLIAAVGPLRGPQRLVLLTRKAEKTVVETRLGEVRLIPRLGDLLVDLGSVARHDVEEAALMATRSRKRIGEVLIGSSGAEEIDVYRALGLQQGLRLERLSSLLEVLDRKLLDSVPRPYLDQRRIIPLYRKDQEVCVATTEPGGNYADLAQALKAQKVTVRLITPTDYRRFWSSLELGVFPEAEEVHHGRVGGDLLDAATSSDLDARIVNLFESMLLDAVGERTSDIHLERYDDDVRVRFRIDGDCVDQKQYHLKPAELLALVNVIKINASMDIAERRLPQGGRIRRRAGNTTYDLRVQTQPSLHGEHVVIRLLPQNERLMTIEDLGFPSVIATQYRRLIDSPAGLLLVVGPTGSGKSTTLYAALQILASDTRRKVITVEDPIEYALRGIQQCQVKPRIGFAFADAMRAFVREDPDVILVGEIRDQETGLEAVRASQTGHLVLSTLHANDAVDAVQRLFDLGLHANSVASEVIGVIAQRLAKRICSACRIEVAPNPAVAVEVFPDGIPEGFRTFKGKGCPRCQGRGTHGRVAAIEFLRTGSEVRRAISRKLQVDELRDLCLDAGLITMRDSAVQLVQDGVIPFEELPRILPAERMAPERHRRA
jgi:type IV pilus assembly protein PilB